METIRRALVAGWLAGWGANGVCSEWSLEVRNGDFARRNAVVHQTVTRQWISLFETHMLVETTAGQPVPVPCALDASGEAPELIWFLSGQTEPNAIRTFEVAPKRAEAVLASDLFCATNGDALETENSFYKLKQPVHGGGGFPREIAFVQSGTADPQLHFLDRLVRVQGNRVEQYSACDCPDSESRVVFNSPLRVVVEVRTGFGPKPDETPERPRAVYRYAYTAFSPVVEVSARYVKEGADAWRELHFLHLTRDDRHYEAFVTGDPVQRYAVQPKGARSKSVVAPRWAVMDDGKNACGTGFGGSVCWDASDEFVYYVRSADTPWEERTHRFDGGLYFGPAKDDAWYSQWMGDHRQPEVRTYHNGKTWVASCRAPLKGEYEVRADKVRAVFDAAAKGFDCLGIEAPSKEDPARFGQLRDGVAGLWSMTFKAPADASGSQPSVVLDNHAKAAAVYAERMRNGWVFHWKGLDLPGEPGVVDVRAEVLSEAGSTAWRLKVENRSKKFGAWSTDYPLLRGVVTPGVADVLLPKGNWGGTLERRFAGEFAGEYPSVVCPLQMMAFQLGDTGLYLAAHDGAAQNKRLVLSSEQDVTFRFWAPNAGVPGSSGAPGYPVVITAYAGDWWQAARLYRSWALKQSWASKGPIRQRTDYPANLQNLGFWMLLNGAPDGVVQSMQEAQKQFAGMPVGVHWYCWHQIPFDNSYPEYFPTLDGMAAATKEMVSKGQTVMPYINGRLWDRDIPSFSAAYAAACKQPTGTNYVETYGSGRYLAPMCPYTALWQHKIQEVCHRLIAECGVNGIYIDQIGSAAPVACYDPSHGHPLGGGSHWVDGYQTMLAPIKAEAVRSGVALTTENTAEPYMNLIDGYLAWIDRHQDDVPLLPAVYSGYTTYFTSPQAAQDSEDAFCAAQARDFLWGCQLGWNDPWILQEAHRGKQQFQRELCRYRLAAKDFMVYGQLLDEVHPLGAVPEVTHVWNRSWAHSARLPVVMGTVWRDDRGRLAVFMVNTSRDPQAASFQLAPERWLGGRGPWRLSLLTPDGLTPLEMPRGAVTLGDLPPHGIRVFVVESAK